MPYTGKPAKKEIQPISDKDNLAGIDHHKKAAKHLEKAAGFHLKAARQRRKGHFSKAARMTIKAAAQHACAGEQQQKLAAIPIEKDQLVM